MTERDVGMVILIFFLFGTGCSGLFHAWYYRKHLTSTYMEQKQIRGAYGGHVELADSRLETRLSFEITNDIDVL
eukprot:CAMPEP_0203761932 /NCGR_PEP_ID=MMETSP0098-20131031/14920_1 /ASSEMBLY_ACC=CAM_ASM_000208 /TAXON_ID=96639 /ORGANISM=" , Strain NY0313808BC1" /LENGTH=73 /DNA_ID=CAMNT_0050656129 /DNA_START=23 /DNA_END=244 /DNA_ORIENTATION=-